MGNKKICEMCSDKAVAYCESDSAFLCLNCDAKVHGANFLVARHLRQLVCSSCDDFTGDQVSGVGFEVKASICNSCSPTELGSGGLDYLSSSSSSSGCVSSARKKKQGGGRVKSLPVGDGGHRTRWGIDSKTVGIFVHWCKRFGVKDDVSVDVVRMACNCMAVCAGKLTVLPFRVCLVASLWFGLRFGRIKSLSASKDLTRLEMISGVPARLILATESKVERLYKAAKKHQDNLESQKHEQLDKLMKEDWAESS